MNTREVLDKSERNRLQNDFEKSLFVEAGAGTGKTAAVVSRIVAMVGKGLLTMEKLVAITFTIAAAGELRVRIREGLEAAARKEISTKNKGLLIKAAGEVNSAQINTIHAFCKDLLQMYPIESGLPSDFKVLPDILEDTDTQERFRQWFNKIQPDSAVEKLVQRGLVLGATPDNLYSLFVALAQNLNNLPLLEWSQKPQSFMTNLSSYLNDIEEGLSLLSYCHTKDTLFTRVSGLQKIAEQLKNAKTEDTALNTLLALESYPAFNKTVGSQINWNKVNGVNACKKIKQILIGMKEGVSSDLTTARENFLAGIGLELKKLLLDYAKERQEKGVATYLDLLVKARDLLRDHGEVREALLEKWDFLAIDEFQDTDPLQVELVSLLSPTPRKEHQVAVNLPAIPGRVCLVGDPKQSIYRFRRADMEMYSTTKTAMLSKDPNAQVSLSVNFRSGQRIIDVVNLLFGGQGGLMNKGEKVEIQAPYVELKAHNPKSLGSVHIFGNPVEGSAANSWLLEAKATAQVVRKILDEKWLIGEEENQRICEPGDICVLMPSRTNLHNLERQFENERVGYRLESGALMVATQEVRDLINILRCVLDPTDQVSLVAALRAPAFGCSDTELLEWKTQGGKWTYLDPGSGVQQNIRNAFTALKDFHQQQNKLSVAYLIQEILSTRLLYAAAYDNWNPQETLRRYRFVMDKAREMSNSGKPTLQDTIDYFDKLITHPTYDSVIYPSSDEKSSIRLMTVHAAKGLEFPITIVVGLGRQIKFFSSAFLLDKLKKTGELYIKKGFSTSGWALLNEKEQEMDEAERVRLLYVALTRPRDHLVVSVYHPAKYPASDAAVIDGQLRDFSEVEVLASDWIPKETKEPDYEGIEDSRPAQHRIKEESWLRRRNSLLKTFGQLKIKTATGIAHSQSNMLLADSPSRSFGVAVPPGEGAKLGEAVHEVLKSIDMASKEGLDQLAHLYASKVGIKGKEDEIKRLVLSILNSEEIKKVVQLRYWREVPVGVTISGFILEGIIDLIYEKPDGGMVIVDYKTDFVDKEEIEQRMVDYELQGGFYALALEEILGKKVSRILFIFANPNETRTLLNIDLIKQKVLEAIVV